MTMMQYNIVYTALSTLPYKLVNEKSVRRNTFGSGQDLFITVVNEKGVAVDCSAFDTYKKIYIGQGSTKIVDGGTLVAVDNTTGKYKYPITATNFDTESTDINTWNVEVILGNNATYASQTVRLIAGNATIKVVDTIMD